MLENNEIEFTEERVNNTNVKFNGNTFFSKSYDDIYKTLFEQINASAFILDLDGEILEANWHSCDLFGYDMKELRRMLISDLFSDDFNWDELKDEIIAKGGLNYESENKSKDKTVFPTQINCSLFSIKDKPVLLVLIYDITERKKTEKKIRASEERYRTIFDNSAVAIMMTNEKEEIISWNRYTEKLLNMSKNDLLKKPVKNLYPENEWLKIREENVREKGMQHHLETKMFKKNGGTVDVDISVSILKNDKGKIKGSIGVIRDITERKQAVEELKIKDKAINSSINAIAITDMVGNITFVNQSFLDMWDYETKDNIIGKPIVKFWKSKGGFVKLMDALVTKGGWMGELEAVTRNNESFYTQLSATTVLDANNEPMCMMASFVDISKRKNMEKDLKKSREKFQKLYEKAPTPYHTLNSEGVITDVNEKWCQILRYDKEEVIGKSIFDFMPQGEKESAKRSFEKKLSEKKMCTELNERVFLTKNGEEKNFEISDYFHLSNEDNINSIFTTMMDITEHKRLEEELMDAQDMLLSVNNQLERKVKQRTAKIKKLLEQKDDFISQLGHDLKTPLTPLNSLLPVIKKKETDEKSKKYIDLCIKNVEYMKNLVQKTLKLALLNSTSYQFETSEFNVYQLVKRVFFNMSCSIENFDNIELVNRVDKSILINADMMRFEELICNLVSNAIKYSPDGGKIVVDAEVLDNEIKFSVKDEGMGIKKEDLGKIFDEFYKVDESRHDFKSNGLGLSICQRIVDIHNGRIWVESKGVGEGSIFYFTIPKNITPSNEGNV
jgi:PAS domain S-box-containing protein